MASGCLAIFSKENAATLPIFIFLYEWLFFQAVSTRWLKRNLSAIGLLCIFLLVIAIFFLGFDPVGKIMTGYADREFSPIQRLLTEFRVVVFYISLIFFPHPSRLNLDHDFTLSHSLLDPLTTLVSLVLLSGMTITAIFKVKQNRFLSFCILWFLGNHLIESSIIGLEIIFEHRNYLPSMLFIAGLVMIAYDILKHRPAILVFGLIMVVILSAWSYDRNNVWRNEISLWEDSAKKSPGKARPQLGLGYANLKMGNIKEAIVHFQSGIEKSTPGNISPVYYNNLGVAHMVVGNKEAAISSFKKALEIDPNYADAVENFQKATE
jgi:hypothetical protein